MHHIVDRALVIQCLRDIAVLLHQLRQHSTSAVLSRGVSTVLIVRDKLRMHVVVIRSRSTILVHGVGSIALGHLLVELSGGGRHDLAEVGVVANCIWDHGVHTQSYASLVFSEVASLTSYKSLLCPIVGG